MPFEINLTWILSSHHSAFPFQRSSDHVPQEARDAAVASAKANGLVMFGEHTYERLTEVAAKGLFISEEDAVKRLEAAKTRWRSSGH